MKCTNCGQENRAALKFCKKCGVDLTLPPAWFPDWRWHLKALCWIYLALVAVFFSVSYLLKRLPPPYDQRQIPPEMTPWLNPHKVPGK
ncbi:MAG TPA: hypothetical protein DCS63_10515 [Elusimicrobia bacterium]|nr:hypothetical protein [Elusimicrobiota bacterium]